MSTFSATKSVSNLTSVDNHIITFHFSGQGTATGQEYVVYVWTLTSEVKDFPPRDLARWLNLTLSRSVQKSRS